MMNDTIVRDVFLAFVRVHVLHHAAQAPIYELYAEDVTSIPNALTIGKLASRGGVNVQTIRYYERSGLLPKPLRGASGYRLYADDAVRRLSFIKQAQLLGFTLTEIHELLSLRMQLGTTYEDIRQRASQNIGGRQKRFA